MAMPPRPAPSHVNELARAGTERALPTSAAIDFSATTAMYGAPKAIDMMLSETVATTHDVRVSILVMLRRTPKEAGPRKSGRRP